MVIIGEFRDGEIVTVERRFETGEDPKNFNAQPILDSIAARILKERLRANES